ncbi:MAG: nicotinate (nicotinamide) nucleotide adenylyltransferase [Alphaproteobacteria bacterium]|nr:nicotinate (nicotinamide) nucleotide adenylyltransferase [Alphaproteobacteria bacterium]
MTDKLDHNSPKKIGLLGGSFNPAHEGHVYISNCALDLLGLDEIWWLISPQNPLKSSKDMATFERRFESAVKVIGDNHRIKASDLEKQINSVYTCETIQQIQSLYPQNHFVWLMGADNMMQFPQWKNWKQIIQMIPIAIFARNQNKPVESQFVIEYNDFQLTLEQAREIATREPPAWVFLNIREHPQSSTALRQAGLF